MMNERLRLVDSNETREFARIGLYDVNHFAVRNLTEVGPKARTRREPSRAAYGLGVEPLDCWSVAC